MAKKQEYAYSLNGKTYEEYEDILAQLDSPKLNSIQKIFKGTCVPKTHVDFFGSNEVSNMIENVTNNVNEDFEDYGDNYCYELELKEHQKNLTKIILDYMNKNIEQPTFYSVENVEEITIEAFKKMGQKKQIKKNIKPS